MRRNGLRQYEEFFVLFLFFSSRKPYIIRNVPETWRDGDGNVYLFRINPVNSLVRDFLSRLFFPFCSERKNIVFNAVCGMSDHLWKNSKKMEETYKKAQAKIAHKRNKLMFNIFFLGSLWLNSYEPFLCHIFILHVISLLLNKEKNIFMMRGMASKDIFESKFRSRERGVIRQNIADNLNS